MAAVLKGERLSVGNTEYNLSQVVMDIRSKRLNLVKFVEDLGPQLTSTDVEKRGHGVRLLSDVLHHLVGYQMQKKEGCVIPAVFVSTLRKYYGHLTMSLFAEFLCDRLKDQYSIIPVALFGILALVTNQSVGDPDAVKIVQTIFKEVHIQSLLKEGRLTVFTVFAVLLDKHLKALTTLGNDFVFGFIQAVDGEKDPKNLLLVFRLVRIIICNFSIDLFAEDLFEVTSCYFPVDFTPPTDDPYGIKKEDLVSSLRTCLAATNQFAPFCLPLLMEKLSSDIVDAKVDSLLTLAACLEVYQSSYLLEHLDELWASVKTAVFHSSNTELEVASLAAVTSSVRNICGSMEDNSQEKYEELLETIQKDCRHFTGPDVRLMKPAGKILHATALASEPTCQRIIHFTLPLLLEKLKENIETNHKKNLISVIGDLLKAAKTFHRKAEDSPVLRYKDSLCGNLFSLLSDDNSSLCSTVLDCLITLVDLTGLLTHKEVELLVRHLIAIVLSDREAPVNQTSTASLAQLSRKYPSVIISIALPLVLVQLKTEDGSVMDVDTYPTQSTPASHQCVLDALSAVCTEVSVVCEVIPRVIEHAQKLCKGYPRDGVKSEAVYVFQCILNIVEGSLQAGLLSAAFFKQNVIPQIMAMVVSSALNGSSDDGGILKVLEVLDRVAAILRTVTRELDIESARSLLHDFATLYLEGRSPYWQSSQDEQFLPFELTSPWQQTQLVCLLTATLCSASRELVIPRQLELVPRLQCLACHCNHDRIAVSGAQCLAGIINKIPDGDELTALLDDLINRIWQVSDKDVSRKRATTTCWLWLTKALVVRWHAMASKFIEKVLSLLVDETVGRLAADGFYIIMADFEEVMNVKMHVNYKLMYRQRLFMETAPKLIEGFHSAKQEFKHHYLCALSHLLQWIPKQVLLSEVPNLMPLLVQSLSCDEPSLKLSTLQTVYSLVMDAPEIITRHVTSLVPMLLGLSKFQSLMKIRMEALRCLGAMTILPHHVVYPYKPKVCRALADSVDDRKRLVRREAVKCRNEWYLLGSSVR